MRCRCLVHTLLLSFFSLQEWRELKFSRALSLWLRLGMLCMRENIRWSTQTLNGHPDWLIKQRTESPNVIFFPLSEHGARTKDSCQFKHLVVQRF